jgi:dienelactone hydrolase
MPIKIGVVSNELFTEHYLRRHFAWYNSELWLEDIPEHTKVLVCLSEEDPIVPAQKVQQEIKRRPEVDVLVWENAGHAHCVTRPKTWRQMQMVMKRQEQMIFMEDSLSSSSSASPSSLPYQEKKDL